MKKNKNKIITQQIYVGIGLVIDENKNKVLLVKRYAPEIPEYDEKWELPGGKIKTGEAFEEGIEREVREETGISVKCGEIFPFTFNKVIKRDSEVIQFNMICGKCEIQEKTKTSNKNENEFKWFSIENLSFDKILPGSKEFLIWGLSKQNLDNMIPEEAKLYEINLESIEKSENKFRGYRILLLFKPEKNERFWVECQYGRIGTNFKKISKSFYRLNEAINYAKDILEKRRDRGYVLTFIEQNHPLRSWVQEENIPFHKSAQIRLFENIEVMDYDQRTRQ